MRASLCGCLWERDFGYVQERGVKRGVKHGEGDADRMATPSATVLEVWDEGSTPVDPGVWLAFELGRHVFNGSYALHRRTKNFGKSHLRCIRTSAS